MLSERVFIILVGWLVFPALAWALANKILRFIR
jgi:hypothetical protein